MPEEKKLSNSVAAVLLTLVVVALIVGAAKSGIDYGKQQAQQPPEVMQAVRLAEQMPSSTPWALDYRIQSGRPVQQQPQAMQQQQMAPYVYGDLLGAAAMRFLLLFACVEQAAAHITYLINRMIFRY